MKPDSKKQENSSSFGILKDLKFLFYPLILFITFLGCNTKGADKAPAYQPEFAADTSTKKTLVWGFPSFSYCENAELIVKYLNKRLTGSHIIVKACVNWDEYVGFLNQGKFDITLVNGLEAIDATKNGYTILGKIMDDSQYNSVILVRKDANVKKVGDLKGKTIALHTSRKIPGVMMPLYYLHEQGLNVNKDIKKMEVASFESAIISTYLGKSEAGLCLKRSWSVYLRNHPEVLSKVEVKWETAPLIHNALLLKNTIDKNINSELMTLFLQMHTTDEGTIALKQLDIGGFETATSDTYKPLLEFQKKYDAVIH